MRHTAAAVMLASATPALAHPGHDQAGGVVAGLIHPFTGVDHLLAMTLVGVWAARGYPRAVLALPATFMAAMGIGFLAAGALPMGFTEAIVLLSLPMLLAGTVAGARVPLPLATIAVGVVALAHGRAHAAEASGDLAGFAAGMLGATAVLHLMGLVIGWAIVRLAGAERGGRPTRHTAV